MYRIERTKYHFIQTIDYQLIDFYKIIKYPLES
ncbi:hypothetical protein SAMN05444420_104134 [Capnocytophaga granulosa]|uniref:Uncharacterized protein n=1 Tax=Capnocytophaga granulosa TaxID=45242 RepID=A0A1H2WLT8_9FLAO|nr:hypothetical protein SAMN05444420_104134 [Capnocytophaga granulosa]SUX19370.1 Uncharacterised protein [Capnocytophaga granulosa]